MLKEIHDDLLSRRPEGAAHDPLNCTFCMASTELPNGSEGGSVSKTYTEEDVAELQTQLAAAASRVEELEAAHTQTELDAKIVEITAAHEATVAEFQSKLDVSVLEAETAKNELTETLAYLQAEKDAEDVAAESARVLDERIVKVREVASFPDTYIEANAERWAAMEEAAFEAVLEDWKNIAAKTPETAPSGVPGETAMATSRENTHTNASILKDVVVGFRQRGIDPRTI